MPITPETLLHAYAAGLFPMARGRHGGTVEWFDPELRGVLPLDKMHVPRRLQKTLRRKKYRVTFDTCFESVIRGCADARAETWINDAIIALYAETHKRGFAHSAEAWEGGKLVGGVYGIALGGAFFGESMFSTATDASKVALVHLVARLKRQGYVLFDTQFINDHLLQFGCVEVLRAEYHRRLRGALQMEFTFHRKNQSPVSMGSSADSSASPVCFSDLEASGDFSGEVSGALSLENFSDFADVEAFLHSITQTS
jgi:leucyl/phenylalanyl-tRNA--protein transferase